MIPKRIPFFLYISLILVSFFCCQKKKQVLSKPKNTYVKNQKYISKADNFYDKKEFDSAFYFYNEAITTLDSITNKKDRVYCISKMAGIQYQFSDYIGSETTAAEALSILKDLKDPIYSWEIYTILGNNYLKINNYSAALFYFYKAFNLDITEKQKLETESNIATVFLKQEKYQEALDVFLSVITNDVIQENQKYLAEIFDKIGFCYFNLHNKEALSYYDKSLQIQLRLNDTFGLGKTYYYLAEYYKNSNTSLSAKYAKLSYQKYTANNNIPYSLRSLAFLIKLDTGKELKKNSIAYIQLKDSFSEMNQKKKNLFARIKYDSKKEKEENLKLLSQKAENELQIEKQQNNNIISYIVIFLAFGFIILIYFYLTSRLNRQKIEATYKSETRISKKLHDELANDVYHIMAFVESRNLSIAENKQELLNNLDDIYSRSNDVSRKKSLSIVDKNYNIALRKMISEFNAPDINILVNGLDTISWDEVDKTKKTALYRVTQELLVNMKKHSNANLVAIIFKETDKNIILNYTDNGKGADVNKMILKNGLHNIKNRILAIKGEIDIDSDLGKGFKVFIKFSS